MPIWQRRTDNWFWSYCIEEYSADEWNLFVEELGQFFTTCTFPAVSLSVAYRAAIPSPMQREMLGETIKQNADPSRLAANAIVVDSAIRRGVLVAVNWVAKPKFSEKIFGVPSEALDWLSEFSGPERTRVMTTDLLATVPRESLWDLLAK